jgi:hypothetical protein
VHRLRESEFEYESKLRQFEVRYEKAVNEMALSQARYSREIRGYEEIKAICKLLRSKAESLSDSQMFGAEGLGSVAIAESRLD